MVRLLRIREAMRHVRDENRKKQRALHTQNKNQRQFIELTTRADIKIDNFATVLLIRDEYFGY